MCQVSHDGDGAGTKSTLLPQQKVYSICGIITPIITPLCRHYISMV